MIQRSMIQKSSARITLWLIILALILMIPGCGGGTGEDQQAKGGLGEPPILPPPVTPPPTDTEPPSVPTNLRASVITHNSVTIIWEASTDNLGVPTYKVFRDGVPMTPPEGIPGTSYQDTTVSRNTAYAYTVSALDQAGNNSAQSAPLNVTTLSSPDTEPPSVPTGLQAPIPTITHNSVEISWTKSIDNVAVAGYDVIRNGTQVATGISGTSYQDTNLTANTTYIYTVSAFDQAGNHSAQSAPVSATTLPAPDTTPPTVPTNLVASSITSTTVMISWTASTDNVGVVGYKVYCDGTERATGILTNFYQDTGLTPNTTYAYTVSAYDQAGNNSAQSASVNATTSTSPDTSPPSVPTNLQASSITSTSVTISWTASTDNFGVTGYKVFRNGTQVATVTSGTSYPDTSLTPNTTYAYTVNAYDQAGNNSAQSASVNATTLPDTTPPSVPTNLVASGITSTTVTISWTASTDNVGVTDYRVFRNGTQVGTTPGTSYQDTNLTANTTYAYTVSAYDQAGNPSAQSAPVNATTTGTPPPPLYSVTLAWDANTEPDLAGYWLYGGTSSGVFTANRNLGLLQPSFGNTITYTISDLPYGAYYFAVKAYNSSNIFSDYSSPKYGLCVNVSATPTECPK